MDDIRRLHSGYIGNLLKGPLGFIIPQEATRSHEPLGDCGDSWKLAYNTVPDMGEICIGTGLESQP